MVLVLPGLVRSDDLNRHLLRNEGKIYLDFEGAQPSDEVADDVVRALVRGDPALGDPLVPGLPCVRAEARHAVTHEMARTLDDVLSRRTRARTLARDASAEVAAAVAALIAPDLGWSAAERDAQVAGYRASIAAERDDLG